MKKQNKEWIYSETVKDHFFHPRNILLTEQKPEDFDAEGTVGNPSCGDVMKMWLKINAKTSRIKDIKWRTFGCASAIASTSMFSEMLLEKRGLILEDALKITPQDIMKRLGGLPERKIHCSVLGDKALREAINDYFRKTKQSERIKEEGTKIKSAWLAFFRYSDLK